MTMSNNGMIRTGIGARGIGVGIAMLIAVAVACFAYAVATPQTAYAADKEPTLTLVVKHEENGANRNIAGAEFTVYQIAKIGAGNKYELIDPFTGEKIDFNGTVTAAQMNAAAQSMAKIAQAKKLKGKKATTDSTAKAKFGTLDMGVYLVVQTGAKDTAAKYKTMPPFLVNVPQFNGGETTYDVVASPKPEPLPAEPKKNPQTGDSLDWNMVALAAAAGMGAMLLALFAARKRRQN